MLSSPFFKGIRLDFGGTAVSLLLLLLLSGCAKPERIQPTVRQSLSGILQDAYPGLNDTFAIGPFGGEMGVENLVELGLPDSTTRLIGRDFIQTKSEQERLLEFLSNRMNDAPFLTAIAFPQHNARIDPVRAEKMLERCLDGRLPVLQLRLMEDGKQQNAWLTVFSYPLNHPKHQNRLIWLMSTGTDEKNAQSALSNLSRRQSLTHGRLPFGQDPVHQELFRNGCKP